MFYEVSLNNLIVFFQEQKQKQFYIKNCFSNTVLFYFF